MRLLSLKVCTLLFFFITAMSAVAAPSFSKGISIQGVIAYQDSGDPAQFWYLPTTSDSYLGERLRTVRIVHYGFGPAYYVQTADGSIKNSAGGLIGGTFAYDISQAKRDELLKAINTTFQIEHPRLLPIPLREPKITSVLLAKTFGQYGAVEQNLPAGFQIGPEVAFAAGSSSSLFAQVLGNAQVGQGIQLNPNFSMNVEAKGEFVGDPWTYDIECDLGQVWKSVRKNASASLSLGWFRIGSAQYSSVFKDLNKQNVCTFTQVEGSLDTATYGREMAEAMKEIFQAVNQKAVNGEAFFRFEPNEEAPPVGGGGGFSLFGWSFSVNAGYSESFFNQAIKFQRHVSYTGRLEAPIAFSAVMAVACGPETKQDFADLGNTSEPCITQEKIDQFMVRARRESAAKDAKLLELASKLQSGAITPEAYEKILALYRTITFTDMDVASQLAFDKGSASKQSIQATTTNQAWALVTGAITADQLSEQRDKRISSLETAAALGPTLPNPPEDTVHVLSVSPITPRARRK